MPKGAGTWLLAVGLACVLGVRCDCRSGGGEATRDADSSDWTSGAGALDHVPERAPAYGLFRSCRDFTSLAAWVDRRVHPPPDGIDSAEGTSGSGSDAGGTETPPTLMETLQSAGPTGVAASRPCAVYRRSRQWGFAGKLGDDGALERWMDRLDESTRITRDVSEGGTAKLRLTTAENDGDGEATSVLVDRRAGFLRAETGGDERAAPAEPSGETNVGSGDSRRRRLLERAVVDGDQFAAIVEPRPLLADLELRPRAQQLLERILPQFGTAAFGAGLRDDPRQIDARLLAASPPDEPVAVESLGVATGEVPPVGGLVEPGVLGLLHLSVDPVRLYDMLVAALPARQRRRLRAFWDQMRAKLLVNRPREIADDFTGRALVVFYGLEGEALDASGGDLAAKLARLELTREAVLLPLEERETVEHVLDKLTQISKGRLSRQKGEHTIQYAWLEEGRLEWAVVLADDHLVAVDSPTAFDRAMAYQRRGRDLEKSERREMGVAPLLDRPDASGLYLDTRSIAQLLKANGRPTAARWLRPFQSALLTTRLEDRVSRTEIRLRLDPG